MLRAEVLVVLEIMASLHANIYYVKWSHYIKHVLLLTQTICALKAYHALMFSPNTLVSYQVLPRAHKSELAQHFIRIV